MDGISREVDEVRPHADDERVDALLYHLRLRPPDAVVICLHHHTSPSLHHQ
jgi:hypothetical protein